MCLYTKAPETQTISVLNSGGKCTAILRQKTSTYQYCRTSTTCKKRSFNLYIY
ncbi:hypothetical protein PREVCOP_06432 [Segatella copri DSM 18205]|uniref:Uncharacterized protein n=1 Tax=Segatella copri DSM 18205 TaxID=537011 RepID=D1PGR9_9BACT|nr:hypothetical protein PREVCOP_06432 [Segatella copri DSM 18205]